MRIDKFLANSGIATRSQIRKIIKQKRVKVNDNLITNPSIYIDENKDKVYLDNNLVEYKPFVYIMLNKPSGYVCANDDKKHKTVFDLLNNEYSTYDLFVVGRLDIDTQGFVLITNDGKFAHKLLTPKSNKYKKYYVKTLNNIENKDINKLQSSIIFKDFTTKDNAIVEKIDDKTCYISISEGKFHQVKKMFIACGNEVVFLKRVSINNVSLDENLLPGQFRQLTLSELEIIKEGL